MSLELTLLRLAKDRRQFFQLLPSVPKDGLEESTGLILKAMKQWFAAFPEAQRLDLEDFQVYCETVKYSQLPEDKLALLVSVIKLMRQDIAPELEAGLVERLLAMDLATTLLQKIVQWRDGAEMDLLAEVRGLAEDVESRMGRSSKLPLVEDSPEDLMLEDIDDSGIKFRLSCLRDNMRGLRPGDFGILASRPDAGKTTILCSESSYWLPQLDLVWPGQGRTGLWLNNEGPGGRIKRRWLQSVLGLTTPEISELVMQGRAEGKNLFTEALDKATSGTWRRMKFYDIHGYNSADVRRIIEAENPGFVIIDMIDNINFTGTTSNGGERTDQLLEAMYGQVREWAVKYGFVGVATSQTDVNAEGNRHPTQSMLKDSKTGKQGACDFIITMGKDNDPAFRRSRWINTPKNKLVRPGRTQDPRAEVIFDGERARVTDPQG